MHPILPLLCLHLPFVSFPWFVAAFLPQPETVSEMLSAPIIERLGSAAALVDTSTPAWGAVIGHLEFNGGFRGMEIVDVNCLLVSMDSQSRVQNTFKLQEMMEKAKLEPDTLTYDLLMMAHAQLKRPEEVEVLFRDLKRSKGLVPEMCPDLSVVLADAILSTEGVPPTVFTYAHLLKAYSLKADVEGAGRAFTEMREAGVQPNIVVYTTLIQTCLNRREVPTAWQIFNLMKLKSRATAPDAHTFTLMLHACALEGESERALNLFRDMTNRMKLKPTKETYHALIHALAVRKDYYQEVWRYATEMQQEGFKMDRKVLGTLIHACGKRGDLTRARMLIRHMLGSGKEDIIPDSATYQCLFRAYGNARVRKKRAGFVEGEPPETSVPYVGPDTRLVKREDGFKEDTIPFSQKAILDTPSEVVGEAKRVMEWLWAMKPHLVDTQLVNALLDAYCDKGRYNKFKKLYYTAFADPKESDYLGLTDLGLTASNTEAEALTPEPSVDAPAATVMDTDAGADMDTEPDKNTDRNLPDQLTFRERVPRNLHTFQTALNYAYKARNLSFALEVYHHRMDYLRTKQYYSQYREPERRRLDIQAECSLINTLARCEMLGEAAVLLEATCQKYKIYEPDIATLHIKALQLDDLQTLDVIKRCVGTARYHTYAVGAKFNPRWRCEDEAGDLSRTW
ncbi:hypothetical protein C7212DRAFT_345866 [Tuber magnatum]|uniref:Pentacotripeptide-repeat region of PRORP domain-containing protein n=1 Tax=Tuber magnatum TaxID=42249 RepID=A0A317SKK8_9PEZI|nr:hypothetical protein C7212DRAFT_345866 [Tuber magnatum]